MCEQHATLAAAIASSLANSQVAEGTNEISMIIIKFPDRLKKRKLNICFGPNLTAPCRRVPTGQNKQSNFIIKLALNPILHGGGGGGMDSTTFDFSFK